MKLQIDAAKRVGCLVLSMMALAGCGAGAQSESEIAPEVRLAPMDANLYPANKVVCDPWGGNEDPRLNQGLNAELYYLRADQPRYTRVHDYIENGVKSSQKLFFTALNVPTRRFEHGFLTETGDKIRNDAGEVLNEYFALKYTSVLKLAPEQEEGLYELALLSDDGAILRMRDSEGQYRVIVDNDGDHPTRLGCSTDYVDLKRTTEKVIEIEYYQGPRYHISMTVLMRKVRMNEDGTVQKDKSCGVSGNDTWFDLNNGSKPKQTYTDLLARGWVALTKDNYGLPNVAMYNPCNGGTGPKISNFRLVEASNSTLWVMWETDAPSTSQVSYLEAGAQLSSLTRADNQLRTSHSVIVSGLKADTAYTLQAVSISESYGRSTSDALEGRTEP